MTDNGNDRLMEGPVHLSAIRTKKRRARSIPKGGRRNLLRTYGHLVAPVTITDGTGTEKAGAE